MAVSRDDLAAVLDEIALLLEIKGENPFKTRAYRNGAETVRNLQGEIVAMAAANNLDGIKGLGKALQEKLHELATTGKLEFHQNLRAEFPEGLFDLFGIQGLGPKKVRALYEQLGVDSIDALKKVCQNGTAASLPANESIYIDPTFFQELKQKFGAKGDFAEAYVVAHEVGHHIQKILGYTEKIHSQQGRISKTDYNKLSVRLELHADFLAGVFAHHGQEQFSFLETGDIQEAMEAAEAIGDDRLQERAHGHVQPDLFTHGTSAQRKRGFMLG